MAGKKKPESGSWFCLPAKQFFALHSAAWGLVEAVEYEVKGQGGNSLWHMNSTPKAKTLRRALKAINMRTS